MSKDIYNQPGNDVGKQTNIIEINGKRYNATTGEVIEHDHSSASKSPGHKQKPVLDVKPPAHHQPKTTVAPRPRAVAPATVHNSKTSVMDISRVPAKHAPAHKPEAAKTLMRRGVIKPSHLKTARKSKVVAPLNSAPVIIHPSSTKLINHRLGSASKVPQSQLITHFTPVSDVSPHIKHSGHNSKSHSVGYATPAITMISQPLDIFERALTHATSHEQPTHKKARSSKRRGFKIASSALAIVLLTGFMAYQNMAAVNLKLASSRAGFAASMPSNRPSGFSIGKFHYSPGTVTIDFHSNSDQRAFAVTQKVSDWNSQALRETFVAPKGSENYQTVEAAGRTIYVYGEKNATWVNGGVWYNVVSDGSLSKNQLIELATSM